MNIISIRNMNDEIATPTNRRMKIEFKSIKKQYSSIFPSLEFVESCRIFFKLVNHHSLLSLFRKSYIKLNGILSGDRLDITIPVNNIETISFPKCNGFFTILRFHLFK
ncbi:hypothetical protein BLOT_012145 [Blomia tropicalis]|nr:hypothetical protein BLOT_012145 [Blomia tropicalis]